MIPTELEKAKLLYERVRYYKIDCDNKKLNWSEKQLRYFERELEEKYVSHLRYEKKCLDSLIQRQPKYPVLIKLVYKLLIFVYPQHIYLNDIGKLRILSTKEYQIKLKEYTQEIEELDPICWLTTIEIEIIRAIPHICMYCHKRGKEHLLSAPTLDAALNEITKECISGEEN